MSFNVYDMALDGVPIMNRHNEVVLRDGEPLIKRDLTNANKAIEHISRLTGHMAEGRGVSNQGRALDEMSIEEIDAEQAKIQAEIARLEANKVVPLRVVGDDD